MSTILKALEKLEREKEALRATGPMPISTPGTARGGPAGWYLKPWLLLCMVGVIIVVLGGTAWHFYRQSRGYDPRPAERSAFMDHPQAQHAAEARSQAATTTITDTAEPEPRPPDPIPYGRQQNADSVQPQAIGDQAPSQRPGETSVQEKPAVQQPMSATGTAVPSYSAKHQITPEKVPATDLSTDMEKSEKVETPPTGSPAQPDTALKSNAPADVYRNTSLLTDGRLRIHAIAWAPQPEERMAVINSRVLHEGDSVEDFVVMVIRPDDVVVREKGKSVWRVEFGRP